ncbi:MAG: hypothetical protein GY809_31490, partial [Planctomycetes bacterium]|nr:hypothetical protein [Planctomycetota bacterium]
MRQKGIVCIWLTLVSQCCLAAGTAEITRVDDLVILSNGAAEISFDLKSGRYSGKNLVTGKFAFTQAQFRLDAGKRPWRAPDMVYRFEEEGIR